MTWILLPLLLSVAARTSASLGGSSPVLHWLAHPLTLIALWIFPLLLLAGARKAIERHAQRLPMLGNLYRSWLVCLSAKALAELLDSGVSLTESLPLAGSIALSESYKRASELVAEHGKNLAEAVESFYPPLLVQMLSVGETTGQVPQLLLCGVHMLETDCRYQVEVAARWLEPVLLLAVGLLVGLVCILSLRPLFEVLQNL
jgi:type IV pilus assembly protein PilC